MHKINKNIHKFGIVSSGFKCGILDVLKLCGHKEGLEINADYLDNGHKIKIKNQEVTDLYNYMHVYEYRKQGNVLGANESKEQDFISVAPPDETEYVLADFSLLITNQYVLFCGMSGQFSRNKSKASYLLNWLILKVNKSYSCNFINLCREDVVKKINDYGVKEIIVGSYLTSDEYAKIIEEDQTGLVSKFKNFFGTTETGMNRTDQNEMIYGINLTAKATQSTMNKKELVQAALRYVLEDEPSDYKIYLKGHKDVITPTEMRLVYDGMFYPFENSVHWESVKARMIEVM